MRGTTAASSDERRRAVVADRAAPAPPAVVPRAATRSDVTPVAALGRKAVGSPSGPHFRHEFCSSQMHMRVKQEIALDSTPLARLVERWGGSVSTALLDPSC